MTGNNKEKDGFTSWTMLHILRSSGFEFERVLIVSDEEKNKYGKVTRFDF